MIILPPLDDHLKHLTGTATSFRALFIVGFRLVPENPDLNENPGQRPVIVSSSIRVRSAALTEVSPALLYLNPRAGVPMRRIPDF